MSVGQDVKLEHDYDSDTSEIASKPFRPLTPDGPDEPPVKRRRLSLAPASSAASAVDAHVKQEPLYYLEPAEQHEQVELDFPSEPDEGSESDDDEDGRSDEADNIDEPDNTDPQDYLPSTVGLAPRAHPRDRADDRYIMRYTTVYPPKALRMARIREESELFRKARARVSKVRCLAPPRPKRTNGSVSRYQARKWAKMRKGKGGNVTWIEPDLCRMWMMVTALLQVGWPTTPSENVLDGVRVHFALKRQSWTMVERMVSRVVWKFGGQVYTSEKHFLAGPADIPRYRLQAKLLPDDVSLEPRGKGVLQMSYFHLAQIVDRRRGGVPPDQAAQDAIRAARRPIANIGFMSETEWETYVKANLIDRKGLYAWIRLRLFVEAYEWVQRTVPATMSNLMDGCEVRWTPVTIPPSIESNIIQRALALIAYSGGGHKMLQRHQDEEDWMSRGSETTPIDLSSPSSARPTKAPASEVFGDAEADTISTLLRAMARLDARCSYTR